MSGSAREPSPAQVGYYVHHHGSGHLHRAGAVARALAGRGTATTGLSSLERPEGWPGDWLRLPLDHDGALAGREQGQRPAPGAGPVDPTAHDRLHWAPLGHRGLAERHARLAGWFASARPGAVVVDVSVEVALLARLHGVPVVAVVLPGRRDDPAHRLGHDVADALVGLWPAAVTDRVLDVADDVRSRVCAIGGLSRFGVEEPRPARSDGPGEPRRVVVLGGRGGDAWSVEQLERARAGSPGWEWLVLGGTDGTWVADPREALREADVVLTHAGQNALAEVAALRRPALVVPADRPHDEQRHTARALDAGPWPVVALERLQHDDWPALLGTVRALDARAWSDWADDGAADRFAAVVQDVVAAAGPGGSR